MRNVLFIAAILSTAACDRGKDWGSGSGLGSGLGGCIEASEVNLPDPPITVTEESAVPFRVDYFNCYSNLWRFGAHSDADLEGVDISVWDGVTGLRGETVSVDYLGEGEWESTFDTTEVGVDCDDELHAMLVEPQAGDDIAWPTGGGSEVAHIDSAVDSYEDMTGSLEFRIEAPAADTAWVWMLGMATDVAYGPFQLSNVGATFTATLDTEELGLAPDPLVPMFVACDGEDALGVFAPDWY